MKIQFGSGLYMIDGWENTNKGDVDISNKLPYKSNSIEMIWCEHVIEHISHSEAVKFLKESYRILEQNGVIRLAFPDIARIIRKNNLEYMKFLSIVHGASPTPLGAVQNIIDKHEHKAFWTFELMETILHAIGFITTKEFVGVSMRHPELRGLECGGDGIKNWANFLETSVIEGVKGIYNVKESRS